MRKPDVRKMVSIVAHKLKTPISIIKGCLEVLIDGEGGVITGFQKEYLSDALENLKRISDFVENLLDVSRIEEGELDIKSEPVSLEKVVSEVLSDLSFWIKANNCQVFFEKPKRLPRAVCNRERIKKTIQNLIGNAVLYKEGSGRVKISLTQKKKQILFTCRDNGIGISKKDEKKIFSKFFRSEGAMKIDPSGAGIRLYIDKAIINLSGGKMWFEKNKQKGTTFYFSLPIAKT